MGKVLVFHLHTHKLCSFAFCCFGFLLSSTEGGPRWGIRKMRLPSWFGGTKEASPLLTGQFLFLLLFLPSQSFGSGFQSIFWRSNTLAETANWQRKQYSYHSGNWKVQSWGLAAGERLLAVSRHGKSHHLARQNKHVSPVCFFISSSSSISSSPSLSSLDSPRGALPSELYLS